MKDWWQKPFRIFQTNLREIDASLDVEQILDDLQDFNATAWLLNTGGIVSFFPSRLPYQHPSPWLAQRASGDLIGDAVAAAHRRGIRVISRFDFSKLHRDVYAAHPDWFFHNAQGKPQVYNELYSTCPSAPYNQEFSFHILAEVLEQYPIDGVFFNMFGFQSWDYSGNNHGICQCVHCRRRFEEQYNLPLPFAEDWDDPAWVNYLNYRRQTANHLSARMRDFIHQKRPDVGLVLYMDAGEGDVILHEINNAISRPQPYWSMHAGEAAKLSQGEYPGKPVVINSVLFLDIPYRFANEQPGYVGLRLAQILGHGANPYVYVIGTTQQADRRNHADVRSIFGHHARNAELFKGLVSAARVALILPQRSQMLCDQGKSFEPVTAAFRGWYRVLTETHTQFDVFYDTSMTTASLERYDALVLPNAACLSEQEGAVLDAFVQAGGSLLATGETGLFDQRGQRRARPLLACLGLESVEYQREDMRSACLTVQDSEKGWLVGLEDTELIAVLGRFLYSNPRPEAQGALTLLPPMRYGPPEKCYPEATSSWPGLLWQDFGQGRTALFPWQPDRFYYSLSLPEYRILLDQTLKHMGRRPVILDSNAGPQVEIIVRDQPHTGRRIVTLINYSGQNGRSFFPPVEMRDIWVRLEVDRPVTRVRAAVTGAALELTGQPVTFENLGGQVRFNLPVLGLFEQIILEP